MNTVIISAICLGIFIYILYGHIIKVVCGAGDVIFDKITDVGKTVDVFRPHMTVKGSELYFLSQIHKNGFGIDVVSNHKMQDIWGEDNFKISSLSISEGTYVASGMATFVVKLNKNKN